MLKWAEAVKSIEYAGRAIAPVRRAMRTCLREFQFAARVLRTSPAFTAVAVLTLGLGIACTTTVFSWVDGVLLRPFGGAGHADELAVLERVQPTAPNGAVNLSWLDYRDYRAGVTSLAGLAVRRTAAFTLGDGPSARLVWGDLVSANYFDVLEVKPLAGRFFSRDEDGDAVGGYPVTVISETLWRGQFRADPAAVGRTILINRRPITIVGVVPASFRSPIVHLDLWAPVAMGPVFGTISPESFTTRGGGPLETICRLRPGATVERARAEAGAVAARLAAAYPKSNTGLSASVLHPWEQHNGVNEYLRRPLTILLAVSLGALLIVCANVANLLLARSVSRQREFAIRCAIGAGRWRVTLQVMTETLTLAICGAGVGLLLLLWLHGSLTALIPSIGLPIESSAGVSGRVLAFTAIACVVATVVAGVSPALFVLRSNLNSVLQEGGRGDTSGAASRRMRSLLVGAEVALAMMALVGAGLFVRSFRNVRAIHPGFDAKNVLLGRFFVEAAGMQKEAAMQFSARLQQRLAEIPGIESAAFSDFAPLSTTAGPFNTVRVDGYTPAKGEAMTVNNAMASPRYFATLRIPVYEGRDFTAADDEKAEPAMIVNQAFAARYFHGQSPVGRKVRTRSKWWTVVGLARDGKYFSPAEPTRPFFYTPFRQSYDQDSQIFFFARTATEPADLSAAFRRAAAETDRAAAGIHIVPLEEYTQVASFGQKVAATLMGGLGLLCLFLAASGIYGVMSYTVSQRIGEIGIRMAMGASPARVVGMIVGQGMRVAGVGMATGIGAALVVTRVVRGMLVGVGSADPASFALAAVFLGGAALLSTALPAWRATRSDPMGALRR
jgi:predicted permease